MAIVQRIPSAGSFSEEFHSMGRGDQYSYDALRVLFAYYDGLSDDVGEDTELDVIAICCQWAEYASEEEAENYYDGIPFSSIEHDWLVLRVDGGGVLISD